MPPINKFSDRVRSVRSNEITFLFLFSIASLIWIVSKNLNEIGYLGTFVICIYVTFAIVIEIIIVYILKKSIYRENSVRKHTYYTLLSCVFVFNIYAILLVHTSSDSIFYSMLSIVCVILFTIPYLMFRFNTWSAANVLGCVLTTLLVFQLVWAERERDAVGLGLPDNWQAGNFASKPDVYLLSFDSLISDEVAGFFLNSPEPSYSSYLRSEGFREVEPTMTPKAPTKPSLNAIAAMDSEFLSKLENHKLQHDLVDGRQPSPLYFIFKQNGYQTIFAYSSPYFGPGGPHVDEYIVPHVRVCKHIDDAIAFMGYCFFEQTQWYKDLLHVDFDWNIPHYDQILHRHNQDHPLFAFSYIYSPGHTKLNYDSYSSSDLEEYRARFNKKSENTREIIRGLLSKIWKHSENSVIFVFGDHGAYTSRSWEMADPGTANPAGVVWSEELAHVDRRRVAMFVWPNDFCRNHIKAPYDLSNLGKSLAICLSGNERYFPDSFGTDSIDWERYKLPAKTPSAAE